MKFLKNTLPIMAILSLMMPTLGEAKGAGTSGGLTLLEPYGARPAALGEAFTSVENDIAAFGYNPATLKSLQSGQASFMYQKGLAEDAYGHFMIGAPTKKGSLGLSFGYYNGGDIDLFDGTTERTVTAQQDMTLSLGYAGQMGRMNVGMTGKFLRSELIEQYSANAFAADLGMQMAMTDRFSLGAAVQNIGTQLKFISEGDNLPRIARLGASYMLVPGKYQTNLLVDAPYYMNEAEVRPGAGIELMIGPMAVRGGYKSGSDVQEFSFGAGFMLGRGSIDYAFGMADELDTQHRVSLAMKFGSNGISNSEIVRRTPRRDVYEKETRSAVNFQEKNDRQSLSDLSNSRETVTRRAGRQIYTVKSGDTLGKIARQFYGDSREWRKIYSANRHLLESTRAIEVGQKIVIP